MQLSPKRVQAKPSPASPNVAPVTAPPLFARHPGCHPPAASRKGPQEECYSSNVERPGSVIFPRRDSRCAPPCGRFREARKGILGSMWRLSRLTRPAHSCSLGSRAVGPNPQSPAEAWPLCLGSGLSSEPISQDENKEPQQPLYPNLRLSPTRRFITFLKTPLSAQEAEVCQGCPHPCPKSFFSDN